MQSSVPRFASFRPKAAGRTSDPAKLSVTDVEDAPKDEQKQRHKHLRRYEDVSGEDLKPHPHRERTRRQQQPKELSKQEGSGSAGGNGDSQEYFVADRRGDPGNLVYGRNSRTLVPDYRHPQNWRTLGDDLARRSDPLSAKSLMSNLSRDARYALENEYQYLSAKGAPFQNADDSLAEEYLPLDVGRKRKRTTCQIWTAETTPGEGYSSDSTFSASEISDQHEELELNDPGLEIRQESARLLNRVRIEPHNVHAWLHYIEFQGRWARQNGGKDSKDPIGAAEERGVAEVRISLYEEALKKVGEHRDSRALLILGMLKEGENAWAQDKLRSKWRDISTSNQDCLDVQLQYLNFMQTNFSSFSYINCRQQYAEYLHLLCHDTRLSAPDRAARQIYALLRLASYMRDSGFTELARSLWQALLEISCFTPEWARNTKTSVFKSFGEYWDNEYPRIGEDDSLGWCHFSLKSMPASGIVALESEASGHNPSNDIISAWLVKEEQSRGISSMPGRTTDVSDQEDDPYHVIFFSDIEPFLLKIPPDYRHMLIEAFLCYHQLPALPDTKQTFASRHWWQDGFLRTIQPGPFNAGFQTRIQNSITTTEALFGTYQKIFSSRLAEDHITMELGTANFVCNVLHALSKAMPEDADLFEYYVAFDLLVCPARARKTAKAILKEIPSNLALYNAYALLESRLGNEKVAHHVFSTAIHLGASLDASEQLKVVALHRSWTWEALRLHDIRLALQRLSAIGLSTIAIEITLNKSRDAAIQQSQYTIAALACELLALHSYLSSSASDSPNLPAALQTFTSQSAKLATADGDASYPIELLHQAKSQLIRYHMCSHRPYSPRLIRESLRPSIASFPENTIFLTLYSENERRFFIEDRMRQVTRDILLGDDRGTVIAWLFALRAEIERGRMGAAGATAHSVRATFEKAVGSPAGRHSSILWMTYLLWEVEMSREELTSSKSLPGQKSKKNPEQFYMAKKVWLRGINALPWVKRFVVLGIELLRTCMTSQECRDFVEMLGGRGLRLYDLHYTRMPCTDG